MAKEGPLVASVGGSLLNCEDKLGNITFNIPFLSELAQLFKERAELPNFKSFIVCGGGLLARSAISLAISQGSTEAETLDKLGIEQTHVNAKKVVQRFVQAGIKAKYVESWREMSKSNEDSNVVITGGDVPGHTTDFVAVKIAEQQHQRTVVNLSRGSFIFRPNSDGTPNMLQPISNMIWSEFFDTFKFITYSPGINFPIDPVAAEEAMKAGINIACLDGNNINDLRSYLDTGKIKGTYLKI